MDNSKIDSRAMTMTQHVWSNPQSNIGHDDDGNEFILNILNLISPIICPTNGVHHTQGHWLSSDRTDNTQVWKSLLSGESYKR